MRTMISAATIMCLLTTSAIAQVTTRELLELCASGERDKVGECVMWMRGFFAGAFTAQALAKENEKTGRLQKPEQISH
jgi:hypothetical protein